jgi:hypothetical protein
VRNEGLKGFYRGLGINVLGSVPASGLYFGAYEWFKQHAYRSGILSEQNKFAYHFWGGIFAETIACILFVPIDVVKERRQVQSEL